MKKRIVTLLLTALFLGGTTTLICDITHAYEKGYDDCVSVYTACDPLADLEIPDIVPK
ncbi:MAG: hypothetical protein FWE05_06770 [Defluviitaleaceae bacterium]|nr:hypothetical protein [Defluviitaleaceae bacterium]